MDLLHCGLTPEQRLQAVGVEVMGQLVRISPENEFARYLQAGYVSSDAGTPMSLSSEAVARIADTFQ